jgi:hypothetical protein
MTAGAFALFVERLVKLTQGVNLINILCKTFCMKVFCTAFLKLQFGFVIYNNNNIGANAAHKMCCKIDYRRGERSVEG